MAIAFVQAKSAQTSGATTITTASFTSTAGNFLGVGVSNFAAVAISGSPVSDNKGSSWQNAWVNNGSSSRGGTYYAENIPGGAGQTVTFTPTVGSSACAIAVGEWSGVATSGSLDQTANANSAANPHTSGATATTTQADELVLGVGASNHGAVAAGPGLYTDIIALPDSAPEGILFAYAIVAAAAAYNFQFSYGLNSAEAAIVSTFKGSGIAYVQSKSVQTSGATSITTASFTSTAGNFLAAGIGSGGTIPASPMSDNKSSTWQLAAKDDTSAHGACFYAENIPGGAGQTVTFTPTSSTFCAMGVGEFSGINTSSSLDQTAKSGASALIHDSGNTATTAQANELLIGVGTQASQTAIPFSATAGGVWTDVAALGDTLPTGIVLSYQIVAAMAAFTYTFSNGSALGDAVGVATFKQVSSSTSTFPALTVAA